MKLVFSLHLYILDINVKLPYLMLGFDAAKTHLEKWDYCRC